MIGGLPFPGGIVQVGGTVASGAPVRGQVIDNDDAQHERIERIRSALLAQGVRIVDMQSCTQLIGPNGDRLITTDLSSLTDRALERFT